LIFVSGATGHIGNNVVRAFLDLNVPVTALIRRRSSALSDLNVATIVGNLFDSVWLESQLQEGDILVHCAGVIDLTRKDRLESETVNVEGTKVLLSVCERRKVRLLFVSSVDAIRKPVGKGRILVPSTADLTGVKSHYSMTKAVSARLVSKCLDAGALEGAIVYPSAVIGPYDFKPSRAGAELTAILGRKIVFDLKGGYNFVDVRDVAAAIATIVVQHHSGHFILGAHERTIREFYQTIRQVSKRRYWILPIPVWLAKWGSVFIPKYSPVMIDAVLENHAYDTSRMRELLGRDPIPFEQTVEDTISWFETLAA
jgi:dihydroflavonol-4-reductase